ncbi:MAG: hypothetical protein HC888_07830 [Candidatus Competibacteraceae bacterium]|nr:hypothetical protein [Candidatus Competibacteraceae bacterium]
MKISYVVHEIVLAKPTLWSKIKTARSVSWKTGVEVLFFCFVVLAVSGVVFALSSGYYASPATHLKRFAHWIGIGPSRNLSAAIDLILTVLTFALLMAMLVSSLSKPPELKRRVKPEVFGWENQVTVRSLGSALHCVLRESSGLVDGPSSVELTPPERKPLAGIVSVLLWIPWLLAWAALFLALLFVAFIVAVGEPSKGTVVNPFTLFKVLAILGSIVAVCTTLFNRLWSKSAGHLLEYDDRPPVVYLRAFRDDKAKVVVAFGTEAEATVYDAKAVRFEECLAESVSGEKSGQLPSGGSVEAMR